MVLGNGFCCVASTKRRKKLSCKTRYALAEGPQAGLGLACADRFASQHVRVCLESLLTATCDRLSAMRVTSSRETRRIVSISFRTLTAAG